jgi:hypothetical protein
VAPGAHGQARRLAVRLAVRARGVDGGESYVVKHIARDLDWIMRVLGDGADGARPWALTMWAEGLLRPDAEEIDHVIVGMAYDRATGRLTQVMRDASAAMVPATADHVPLAQHRRFLDHLAATHATFWGFRDTYGLITPRQRYGFAHPDQTAREAAAGHDDVIPACSPAAGTRWRNWRPRRPASPWSWPAIPARWRRRWPTGRTRWCTGLEVRQPRLLARRAHGAARLGLAGRGRSGGGPGVVPGRQLRPAAGVQRGLHRGVPVGTGRQEIATAGWWDEQLDLALVGAFVQLGWSKPANPVELGGGPSAPPHPETFHKSLTSANVHRQKGGSQASTGEDVWLRVHQHSWSFAPSLGPLWACRN